MGWEKIFAVSKRALVTTTWCRANDSPVGRPGRRLSSPGSGEGQGCRVNKPEHAADR